MPFRFGQRLTVLINGSPDLRFHVDSIERSAGGSRLDHCRLLFDETLPPKTELQFFTPRHQFTGATCEVIAVNAAGEQRAVHFGSITLVETDIGTDEEGIAFVSRLERWHFGKPVTFQKVYNPLNRGVEFNGEPIVFNPQAEEPKGSGLFVVQGNMRADAHKLFDRPLFFHPDSGRNQDAADVHQMSGWDWEDSEYGATHWTLSRAIGYLCAECNADETYIQNPTAEDLAAIDAALDNQRTLRDVRIRLGAYLPEALDTLLEPYGYSWRVSLLPGRRKLEVFRLGSGPQKTVLLQEIGQDLDTTQTEIERASLDFDLGPVINKITVYGDMTQVEACWELMPGWDPELNTTETFDLRLDSPEFEQRVDLHDVFRLWVLNESGEMGDSWPQYRASFFDLTPYFREVWKTEDIGVEHPQIVPRRRKFLPTISVDDAGEPAGQHAGGVQVEWYDPDYDTDGGRWRPLLEDPNWSFELLDDRCGLRFKGNLPPLLLRTLLDSGKYPKLRVCATIASDFRPAYSEQAVVQNVEATAEYVVDGSERFHFRRRISKQATDEAVQGRESLYGEHALANPIDEGEKKPPVAANELVSYDAMRGLARDLLISWNQADVIGNVLLEGLDRDRFEIGDLITKIEGREIDLSAGEGIVYPSSGSGGNPSYIPYAQVMGIRYHAQKQQTVLTLRSFRDSDSYFAKLIGKRNLPRRK